MREVLSVEEAARLLEAAPGIKYKAALEQAGSFLGVALANLINATDPGNIMPGVLPSTKIELVFADKDWRWKGTAALALEQTYIGSG